MEKNKITNEYLHSLQACYHRIDSRGILVSTRRLNEARRLIADDIKKQCEIISKQWGCFVYVGSVNDDGADTSVNLNASSGSHTPLAKLKSMGYVIPKVGARDEDGNYFSKESLAELSLQKMFSLNQFGHLGGDPSIRAILRVRELSTLASRYVNANLYKREDGNYFLSNYNCSGTVTGRRGSRKHTFGFGGNGQNFPKHGELAKIYRRCLVAKPGYIFLMVDQIQAEDWPVSALANNTTALEELRTGVDRHTKLASMIFNIPIESRSEKEWKDSMERYLGKKTRHARNYGMRGATMSDSLAKEGISLNAQACQGLLNTVGNIDPSVDGVFHEYVKQCLYNGRLLRTPFNRERQFFGLRAGDAGGNNKIFNEAYSYIPQSTVGDNTGFAVHELERRPDNEGAIIQEGHDSIVQQIRCDPEVVWDYLQRTIQVFERDIVFHNGISLRIPVEGELGFDFYYTQGLKSRQGSKKLTDLTYQDVQATLYKLQEYRDKELEEESNA